MRSSPVAASWDPSGLNVNEFPAVSFGYVPILSPVLVSHTSRGLPSLPDVTMYRPRGSKASPETWAGTVTVEVIEPLAGSSSTTRSSSVSASAVATAISPPGPTHMNPTGSGRSDLHTRVPSSVRRATELGPRETTTRAASLPHAAWLAAKGRRRMLPFASTPTGPPKSVTRAAPPTGSSSNDDGPETSGCDPVGSDNVGSPRELPAA